MSTTVKVRVHYEVSFEVEVPDGADLAEVVSEQADLETNTLSRGDLDWIGTYVEDEDGDEIMSIS